MEQIYFTPEKIADVRSYSQVPRLLHRALGDIELLVAELKKPRPLLKKGANEEWGTPAKIFDTLHDEFEFVLDVCASPKNTKCNLFYSKEPCEDARRVDGLAQDWQYDVGDASHYLRKQGACWCNPPYNSKALYAWVGKAASERLKGVTTVCLVPAKTDQKWYHEFVWDVERNAAREGVEIRPHPGRIKFEGAKHSCGFACLIIVFRGNQ